MGTMTAECPYAWTKVMICHKPIWSLFIEQRTAGQMSLAHLSAHCHERSLLPLAPAVGTAPALKPKTWASGNSLPVFLDALQILRVSFK